MEIIKFLLGESDIDGLWFGDKKPGFGSFWWRTALRQYVNDKDKEIKRLKNELGNQEKKLMTLNQERVLMTANQDPLI